MAWLLVDPSRPLTANLRLDLSQSISFYFFPFRKTTNWILSYCTDQLVSMYRVMYEGYGLVGRQ